MGTKIACVKSGGPKLRNHNTSEIEFLFSECFVDLLLSLGFI